MVVVNIDLVLFSNLGSVVPRVYFILEQLEVGIVTAMIEQGMRKFMQQGPSTDR